MDKNMEETIVDLIDKMMGVFLEKDSALIEKYEEHYPAIILSVCASIVSTMVFNILSDYCNDKMLLIEGAHRFLLDLNRGVMKQMIHCNFNENEGVH